jgi:hypothetical protein
MKKISLNFDPATGQVTDAKGMYIGMNMSLTPVDSVDVEVLVKLKNAGFTADEIIELKRKELI